MDMVVQFLIACTGITALWITQQKNERLKKYACIVGIIGQPFWIYSTYHSEQWGIFTLCFFYSYIWCLGIYNNWIKK